MKADHLCDGMSYDEWESGYGATPFHEWCQHYGYDPDSDQARTDCHHYLHNLAVVLEVCMRQTNTATRPD